MTATLRAALGRYPQTLALHEGRVASDLLRLDLAPIAPINRAFAPMVRDLAFDVSEMAIATFLQAKAYGKPLVLLPVVLAQRFQQSALLCRLRSDIAGPEQLVGRRVGVRAYSQTTGMWLRGILAEEYGIRPETVRWVTFEGAHVAEVADPPWANRAPEGADMMAMLRDGTLDAVIVGNDAPSDPALRTVFPDPAGAADGFFARHHLVPVNHMLTVTRDLADRRPELVPELLRMFAASGRDQPALPIGMDAVQPAVLLALAYAQAQGMLPRQLTAAEVWEGSPFPVASQRVSF